MADLIQFYHLPAFDMLSDKTAGLLCDPTLFLLTFELHKLVAPSSLPTVDMVLPFFDNDIWDKNEISSALELLKLVTD